MSDHIRVLVNAAQEARDDPRLRVEEEGCRFRVVTSRRNFIGTGKPGSPVQRVWTTEPLTLWMSGPDVVEWLREAGQGPAQVDFAEEAVRA